MISIKYDFPPSSLEREPRLPRGALSTSVALFAPASSLASLSLGLTSLPHPPTPLDSLSPRGGNPGFNPFPYNFLPMHREKLARNTHAHARTPGARFPNSSPSHLFHALTRSPALVGGHRLLDFIEFSSSARRHPVQTRIRQLTPLACGGSAIKSTVREVRFTARGSRFFFGATRIRNATASKFRC